MEDICRTHWNFISLDPKITNAQQICNLLREQQLNFRLYTTQSEYNDWR